jgi:uncharacterized membrane protein
MPAPNDRTGRTREEETGLPHPMDGNLDAIAKFYEREQSKVPMHQGALERISRFIGQPAYLGCLAVVLIAWISVNTPIHERFLKWQFDPPPFVWLQGLVALTALLNTIIVLIRQERTTRLAERQSHLDLQVNLLSEQKTTKIIQMLEELRRDMPDVRKRYDPEAEEMQMPTDPHAVLKALETQHERRTAKH